MLLSVIFGIKLLSIIRLIKKYHIDRSVVYLILFSFVLLAAVFAEDIGLSGIVDAFLVGLMITESGFEEEERKLKHMIDPLVLLFSPLFFLNLGLLVNFSQLAGGLKLGLILTFVAITSKYLGCFSSRHQGIDELDSIIISLGMLPRGSSFDGYTKMISEFEKGRT